MQEEWSKCDADTMLGTRKSYSQRAKQRATLYFETADEAAVRVGKRKRQEDLGVRKKTPFTPPHQVDFDKENPLKEVKNMKKGDKEISTCELYGSLQKYGSLVTLSSLILPKTKQI